MSAGTCRTTLATRANAVRVDKIGGGLSPPPRDQFRPPSVPPLYTGRSASRRPLRRGTQRRFSTVRPASVSLRPVPGTGRVARGVCEKRRPPRPRLPKNSFSFRPTLYNTGRSGPPQRTGAPPAGRRRARLIPERRPAARSGAHPRPSLPVQGRPLSLPFSKIEKIDGETAQDGRTPEGHAKQGHP